MEINEDFIIKQEDHEGEANGISSCVNHLNMEKICQYLFKQGLGFCLQDGYSSIQYRLCTGENVVSKIPLHIELTYYQDETEEGQRRVKAGEFLEFFLSTEYMAQQPYHGANVPEEELKRTLEFRLKDYDKSFVNGFLCSIKSVGKNPKQLLADISRLKETLVEALKKDYKGEL